MPCHAEAQAEIAPLWRMGWVVGLLVGWLVGGLSCQAEACSLHCGGFSGGGSFVATLDNCRQEFAEKFAQFYKCPSTNSSAGGLHTDETQCDILLGEPLSRICWIFLLQHRPALGFLSRIRQTHLKPWPLWKFNVCIYWGIYFDYILSVTFGYAPVWPYNFQTNIISAKSGQLLFSFFQL